ncbi:MAG: hypothetical protein JRN06_07200 [Nitrososphaerota archaeon]|nr:hypothetical protein [Nitrososphaerota archaeon]MDG7024433.1 hypothetical protein [Nitrososphaerota archaeon]
MPPEPSLLGYFVFLLFIFVPGIGVGELLGVWRGDDSLMERVGISFGLGLAIDTVVLVVRTSGLSAFGLVLRGIEVETVYFPILVGVAAFGVSLGVRRKVSFLTRPKAADFLLSLVVLAMAAMLLLYFQKYPIFPEYLSPDFAAHVQFSQSLISGSASSIPAGILYYGVQYQLAASLLLVGGDPLVTVQRTMALLVVLSPVLVYTAASRLSSSRGGALVATAIFFVSGTIWFASVFNAGLYANYFGILASLFLVAVVVDVIKSPGSARVWFVFLLGLVAAYFSHYTVITLLPALFVLPLAKFLKDRTDYVRYLAPAAVSVVPGAIAFLASPGLLTVVLALASGGGGNLVGSTTLSSVFAPWPVLGYMALEVLSDVGFVFLLLFAAVWVYRMPRSDNVLPFFLLAWLVSLLVASPFNVSAWRFSFEALVPLVLMAGYGVHSLLPKLEVHRRGKTTGHWKVVLVLIILLSPLLVGSWGQTAASDSLTNTQLTASAQQDVYAAIQWLGNHTTSNARYLSVSDFRFTYTSLLIGRTTDYAYFAQPSVAIQAARTSGDDYVIVTNLVTLALPPDPSLFPWNNFQQSSNLTLAYSNDDVRIFQIIG